MAEPTSTSTAQVPTDRAARYGKQLVSHLSRRSDGAWDDDGGTGWIELGGHRATLAARPESLDIELSAPPDDVARLEDVIGRHLVRFGARDELVVRWVRADGSAGTSQANDGD